MLQSLSDENGFLQRAHREIAEAPVEIEPRDLGNGVENHVIIHVVPRVAPQPAQIVVAEEEPDLRVC